MAEVHYCSVDPDEIWNAMMAAYKAAGGSVLHPGDEKEMLLRGVQAIAVHCAGATDAALRMDTLRYAVGEYLDIYGEKRGCERRQATAAKATVRIVNTAGADITLPAGTQITADGKTLYTLDEDFKTLGRTETQTDVTVTCAEAGGKGNGLTAGTAMQFVNAVPGIVSVTAQTNASGGTDKETDDAYRERIRTYGLSQLTTGPAKQYRNAAMAADSRVIDAFAMHPEGSTHRGDVYVYLLVSDTAALSDIIAKVTAALSAEDVRPLTDMVTVQGATAKTYVLNAQYEAEEGADIAQEVAAAVESYKAWQNTHIGQAFNPDRLMSLIYNAGATRVTWSGDSEFDGGDVEYTAINANEYCSGTVTATPANT